MTEILIPRRPVLERELADLAARAAGFHSPTGAGDDRGLWAYANHRAWPGGVRSSMDAHTEIAEELADGFNYATWEAVRWHDGMLSGDPVAGDRFAWAMRCNASLVRAWHTLHTGPF